MKHLANHSWFFIIEFICITLAVVLWKIFPGVTWQPLLIAIIPLLLRIAAGRSPLVRTPFDLPIVIFLLTAGVGIWTSYQPAVAWTKFWLLIAAILLYYLLSRQPVDNLWKAAGIISLLGLGIGIYFFFSNNWELQPQKFILISQVGLAWMRIRPDLNLVSINPNDIAGIASITVPFSLAIALRFFRRKSYVWSILFGLITGLIVATILLSASRGALLAVGITAGLFLLWWAISRWLNRRKIFSYHALFGAILVLLVCLTVGYTWVSLHERMNEVAAGTADTLISDSRFHIFWSAFELIKDVPFTGGGLDGFPGLYSSYIMINPNYIQGYSHNIFLDASLQQGILGGLMLCWIILGSIVLLASRYAPGTHSLLRYAILSSLLITVFHGVVDNIILRTMFTMMLFFVPGMAIGLLASIQPEPERIWWGEFRTRRLVLPSLIALGLILVGLIIFRRPILSAWYTDLGSVEMAKVELSDFPTGIWDEGQHADLLSPAESLFNRALIYEPTNPRANYRLGLIAMLHRDFPIAVSHLEIAHHGDMYHRGMLKALGFSYLWNGQIEAALPLLSLIPESDYEVGNYTYWWSELNRPDLTAYAEQYLEMVGSRQK
jgi:O-antigen ligase